MSQELMYTSAPRGLKPGSRGFCTVVSTQGISAKLVERLESLSGYRQIYPPNDPNESLNPVVYSHLKLTVDGRIRHVMSRICTAGLDYTQRANKFAHHIVLEENELPPAGPAWLLSQPSFMEKLWDGQARILSNGRRPPQSDIGPATCRAWQEVAGDAGWGGVLAETAMNGNRAGAMIVFRPGMNVLGLISESLSLVPSNQRWETTFSTYFTRLPPGIDCRWRFVLDGSPETALRAGGSLQIDLCRRHEMAPTGIWPEAARTGKQPSVTNALHAQVHSVEADAQFEDRELERLLTLDQSVLRDFHSQQSRPNNTTVANFPVLPVPPSAPTIDISTALQRPDRNSLRSFNRKQRSSLPSVLLAIATLLIVVSACIAIIYIRRPQPQPAISSGDAAISRKDGSAHGGEDAVATPKSNLPIAPNPSLNAEEDRGQLYDRLIGRCQFAKQIVLDSTVRLLNLSASLGPTYDDLLRWSRQLYKAASLRSRTNDALASLPHSVRLWPQAPDWYDLASFNAPADTAIVMRLYGPKDDIPFSISTDNRPLRESTEWAIVCPRESGKVTHNIGSFRWHDGAIQMKWDPNTETTILAQNLQNCVLEVSCPITEEPPAVLALRQVGTNGPPLPLNFLSEGRSDLDQKVVEFSSLPTNPVLVPELLSSDDFDATPTSDPGKYELRSRKESTYPAFFQITLSPTEHKEKRYVNLKYLGAKIDPILLFDQDTNTIKSGYVSANSTNVTQWQFRAKAKIHQEETEILTNSLSELENRFKGQPDNSPELEKQRVQLQTESSVREKSRVKPVEGFVHFINKLAKSQLRFRVSLNLGDGRRIELLESQTPEKQSTK